MSVFQRPPKRIFPKGSLTHDFGQKRRFFVCWFLVKIRLKIMYNDVLDKKRSLSGV